jgi:hypothetical protein
MGLLDTGAAGTTDINPAGNTAPVRTIAEEVLAAVEAGQAEAQPEAKAKAEPKPKAPPKDPAAELDEQVASEGTGKLSWNDALKRVPPDVAALMKAMQADYTKKTQEAAQVRKEAQREREALLSGQAKLKAQVQLPDYDPFDEGSINARIEAEVRRRLDEVLEPMRQEYEVASAQDAYQSFLAENPDLKTDGALRSEVQALLESNPNLDLQTAYWAAKGRATKLNAAKEAAAASADRKARKTAAETATAVPRRGGTSTPAPASSIRRMSAADILAQAQAMHGKA